MSLSDGVGDCLTRVRNAQMARHRVTKVLFSKLNVAVLEVLKSEGYILGYEKYIDGNMPLLSVNLKYYNGQPVVSEVIRVSKPGCRCYSKCADIPKSYNGLGIFVVSTSRGVMADYKARELNVGGEILCRVF